MNILEIIKAALVKAGISEKYAGKIKAIFKVEDEKNLDNYISLFKENILPDLVANEQSIQTASQNAIVEYEKKHNLKDGKPVEKTIETKPSMEGVSPEIKAILEASQKQIEQLTLSVTALTKNVATSGKASAAKELFKDSGLPEKWFGRLNLDDEKVPVKDQIKSLQEELAEIKQCSVNELVEQGKYKPFNGQPKDRSDKEWTEFMNSDEGTGESSGTASLGIE